MALTFNKLQLWNEPGQIPSMNDRYVAYTKGKSGHLIYLTDFSNTNSQPLELIGHHRRVISIAFSSCQSPCWMVSCGEDHIQIWNVDLCEQNFKKGEEVTGTKLASASSIGDVTLVALSPECQYIACCTGCAVSILSTQSAGINTEPVMILEGHTSEVTSASFLPVHPSLVQSQTDSPGNSDLNLVLITVSADRRFMVWHLGEEELIYQSAVLTSVMLTTVACNYDDFHIAMGDAQGKIFIYDSSKPDACREICKLDLVKLIGKMTSDSAQEDNQSFGLGHTEVLSVHYLGWWAQEEVVTRGGCAGASGAGDSFVVSDLRDALYSRVKLFVATNREILVLNEKTLDLDSSISYWDAGITDVIDAVSLTTTASGQVAFCLSNSAEGRMWMGTIALDEKVDSILADSALSFLARSNLLPSSKLHSSLQPKQPASTKASSKSRTPSTKTPNTLGGLNKKGRIAGDRPLTFQTRIASSGYSKVEPSKSLPSSKRMDASVKSKKPSKDLAQCYPLDSDLPSTKGKQVSLDVNSVTISQLAFSDNGTSLACALGNSSCQLVNPTSLKSRCSFIGHNSRVTSCAWSRDDQWVVTSSADQSLRIWSAGSGEVALIVDSMMSNIQKKDEKSPKVRAKFKDVNFGQFYFLDRFLLATSGNEVVLFKYYLDTDSKPDIKRYQSKSKYKLVQTFPFDSCNRITALSAVNRFYSYLSVCVGSDKSVFIIDMNRGEVVRTIGDAHSRTVDHIALNQGSKFSTLSSEGYDMFATVAPSDCVKLWDLRGNKCIQRYQCQGSGRSGATTAELSPCGRYLACGVVEDRTVLMFDIRASAGTPVTRLPSHSETVVALAFHPAKSSVVTLIVGDGDLSFSASLTANLRGCEESVLSPLLANLSVGEHDSPSLSNDGEMIVASCIESRDQLELKYSKASVNAERILSRGWKVEFSVDATRLKERFPDATFDRIIFNFPHVGGKSDIKKNRKLLLDFFESASHVLKPCGQVHMALCRGQGGTPADGCHQRPPDNCWQVVEAAARANFLLAKVEDFVSEDYPDYRPTGFRSQEKAFNPTGAKVHIFVPGKAVPVSDSTVDILDNLEPGGKSHFVQRHLASHYRQREQSPFERSLVDQLIAATDKTGSAAPREVPFQNIFSPTGLVQVDPLTSYPLLEVSLDCSSASGVLYDQNRESLLFTTGEVNSTRVSHLCSSIWQQLPRLFDEFTSPSLVVFTKGFVALRDDSGSTEVVQRWLLVVSGHTSGTEFLRTLSQRESLFRMAGEKVDPLADLQRWMPNFCARQVVHHCNDQGQLCWFQMHASTPLPAFICAFNISQLTVPSAPNRVLHPPSYTHDISFWLPLPRQDPNSLVLNVSLVLADIVRTVSEGCARTVVLLESFVEPVDDGSKRRVSLCYRAVYQSHDSPLSSLLANRLQSQVRLVVARILSAELR